MVKFKLFGTFELIDTDGNTINLEERLGKQLSNVFAMLLTNLNGGVSKEKLISNFWVDSDNPASAIKYSIFRLRSELNKIDILKDLGIVSTNKTGNMINPDVEVEVDVVEMEKYINDAKADKDYELYEKALDYYRGPFLENFNHEWSTLLKQYFERLYFNTTISLANEYCANKHYEKAIHLAEKAFKYDELNEELICAYIKALIGDKQYNRALKYYDRIDHKFSEELDIGLPSKIVELYQGISVENGGEMSHDMLRDTFVNDKVIVGPLFIDYITFKKLYEIELRRCVRNHRSAYIVLFEIKCKGDEDKYFSLLEQVVQATLRINDTYTTNVNSHQLLLLLEVANNNDEYAVIDRLQERFYRRVDSKLCRLNYVIKDVLEFNEV